MFEEYTSRFGEWTWRGLHSPYVLNGECSPSYNGGEAEILTCEMRLIGVTFLGEDH